MNIKDMSVSQKVLLTQFMSNIVGDKSVSINFDDDNIKVYDTIYNTTEDLWNDFK